MNKKSIAIAGATAAIVAGAAILSTTLSPRANWYPESALTPGKADPAITQSVIESPGFTTTTYRDVPESVKRDVFERYGLDWADHDKYEVDHLISIELGGSNDEQNLWPEPWNVTDPQGEDVGAHTKDRIEDWLGRAVKAGQISLGDAQKEISTDWIASYRKHLGNLPSAK